MPAAGMKVTVIRLSDGAEAVCTPGWKPHYDRDDEFWWTEGNMGCDCNRHAEFERSHGREPPDDEWVCGKSKYDVRLESL